MDLIHDRAAHRFRLPLEDGGEAYVEYAERGSGTLDLLHTIVPPESQNEGIGTGLVEQVLQLARNEGLQVVPSCPFVSAFLQNHPEYRDVVA